jgi:hypothetical protein
MGKLYSGLNFDRRDFSRGASGDTLREPGLDFVKDNICDSEARALNFGKMILNGRWSWSAAPRQSLPEETGYCV